MKISLGSILYCWHKNDVFSFYEKVKKSLENSDLDIIYLGESVCAKRKELLFKDWFEIAKDLAQTGKQVVITTLTLVESPSKLVDVKRCVENGEFLIEANDMSAVNLCVDRKLPFVVGSSMNCYNAISLKVLLKSGMLRWCMPIELSKEWLMNILNQADDLNILGKFEIEVLGFGYLPLSISARCFTARSIGKNKSDCEICCIDDPEGKPLFSQENQRLFTMNGIQTQSGKCYDLINELNDMKEFVDIIRLSPFDSDNFKTLDIAVKYREKIDNPNLSSSRLPESSCDGYWYGKAGMKNTQQNLDNIINLYADEA